MHIKSVEFAGAIGQLRQAAPDSVQGLPQVAFAGRSNVGKSSLINHFLGRTRSPIARVSQQPGKTQEINFFRVITDRGDFCLTDLPGYGYARVPEALRQKWRPLIAEYMEGGTLSGVVQLIDMRHGPTQDDLRAIEYLADLELPVLFALTKADKLKPMQRQKALDEITRELGVQPEQVVAASVLSGSGIDTLRGTLEGLLFETGEEQAEQAEETEPADGE